MPIPPPSTKQDAIAALKLFNNKFDRIIGYSFFKQPTELSFQSKSDIGTGKTTITTEAPSDEQLDAVLLHFRFFQMRNEHSSFHHLPTAYILLKLLPETRRAFEDSFKAWMDWRDLQSGINGKKNCEFLAVMLFGERIHRNAPGFIAEYEIWMKNEILCDLSMVFLCNKMYEMIRILRAIRQVNQKSLDEQS